ncbi:retrotransposon protein, putative, ty1-copia subclass [Tanacetum coccineum]
MVKKLRTDNGLKFYNLEFEQLCIESGIVRHLTVAGIPEHNGGSRKATCMAAYLINRSPSRAIEKNTPMEMWSGHPSDYKMLRIFGCVAYPHDKQGKLKPRAVKCVILGYLEDAKGYRLYKLDDESPKIFTSMNVVFNESVMYKDTLKVSGVGDKSVEELQAEVELQRLSNHTPEKDHTDQEDADDEDAGDQETDQPPDLTDYQLVWDRELRTRTKPLRFQDESNMAAYAFVAVEEEDTHEPLTYQAVVACEDIRHISIRVILALTACKDYGLEQLDVQSAFLHGNLEELIYMRQPPGYEQGNKYMLSNGFKRSSYDSYVYYRSYAPDEYIYLLLYVDDMLIACKSKAEIEYIKSLLKKEFDMKELGEAKKILSMEIVRDRSHKILRVSQSGYVSKILNNFRIDNGKSVKMQLGGHFKLSLKNCLVGDCDVERMSKVLYANAVGSLMQKSLGSSEIDFEIFAGYCKRGFGVWDKSWQQCGWMCCKLEGNATTRGGSFNYTSEVYGSYGSCEGSYLAKRTLGIVLEEKTVKVLNLGTEHNAADALTKVVPGLKLQHCLELLNVGLKENEAYNASRASANASTQKEKRARCYICKERGHVFWKCPNKQKKALFKKQKGIMKPTFKKVAEKVEYPEKVHVITDYMIEGTSDATWDEIWYVSSAYKQHMCPTRSLFRKLKYKFEMIGKEETEKKFIFSYGIGDIIMEAKEGNFVIPNVHYTPEVTLNVLSYDLLEEQGYVVKISNNKCNIQYMFGGKGKGKAHEGSYTDDDGLEHVITEHNKFLNRYFKSIEPQDEGSCVKGLEELKWDRNKSLDDHFRSLELDEECSLIKGMGRSQNGQGDVQDYIDYKFYLSFEWVRYTAMKDWTQVKIMRPSLKECYKEYIGMVKIYYEEAQRSKQGRPGEDVVGNSSGTAWIKEPQVAAMKDCIELLSDSVYQMKKSLAEMNRPGLKEFDLVMSDIQTWVSSALTDEDTCSEGFANDPKMKNVVRGKVVNVVHLTSNALGLVQNQAASASNKPPTKNDGDLLFQPMFDEYFKSPSAVSTIIPTTTLLPPDKTRASSSTTADQDAPSLSTSPNNETTASPIQSTNVEEPNEEKHAKLIVIPLQISFAPPVTSSAESSSRIVDTSNMHTFQQPHTNTKR